MASTEKFFQEGTKPMPIDTCEKCLQIYWACACGDSPINGIVHRESDIPPKPERCSNKWHEPGREDLPMKIRLSAFRHCCQSYNHRVGSTCKHCGQKD